jgi:pimeloyl-ACP methyl ester carboxylesterase
MAADAGPCRAVHVPVTSATKQDAFLFGVVCTPGPSAPRPSSVQLLVHGGTYNHRYWDWPLRPERYSYVRAAVSAGYAVLAVDRLGYGQSTRPASALVSLANGAAALHDVVTALRAGEITGYQFRRVVYVGHSVGSIVGWVEASTYRDVDAVVVTGMTHHLKRTAVATISQIFYPASQDPAFRDARLDPGYLTTRPGRRGGFFYFAGGSEPDVIALDEETKDTMAIAEARESLSLILSPPAAAAPSRDIVVPTLLVMGAKDGPFCGEPDGLDCTSRAALLEAEAPYYSSEAALEVRTIQDTGHNIQLHHNAGIATGEILDWLGQRLQGVDAPARPLACASR